MKCQKSISSLLALTITVILFVPQMGAAIDKSCRILALDLNTWFDNESLDRLGISYTLVSPTDFAKIDLNQFDVLYVGSTFKDGAVTIPSQDALDALNARADDIRSFVQSGGGVFASSEPIGIDPWSWIPVGVLSIGNQHRNDVILINSDHPVNTGLSSELLSNWNSSFHNFFLSFDENLTVLATDSFNIALTLGGPFGFGKMVFTGQDPDFHLVYNNQLGAKILLSNALSWLCEPSVVAVTIDIKPGSFPNSINLKSKGNVPVAILSSPTFDATTIDQSTIVFAGTSPLPIGQAFQDVNGDRLLDIVLHFNTQHLNLQHSDTEACLSGKTLGGQDFGGCDSVHIVN